MFGKHIYGAKSGENESGINQLKVLFEKHEEMRKMEE
jgi:hypothetical protein